MTQPTLFLDVGGTILAPDQQTKEWQRLVGSCFVLLLGGTEEGWTLANRLVTERLRELERVQAMTDFVRFYRDYQLNWVRGMCALQKMPIPSEQKCMDLASRANIWISRRMRTALPGAAQTVRLLCSQGYRLYTASGSCSILISGYLEGMGVRHCFDRLYGAELINAFKQGPQYYERIFADAEVSPTEALVVDDSEQAICWAMQVGARTVLVSTSLRPEKEAIPRIGSLAELPAFLQQWN